MLITALAILSGMLIAATLLLTGSWTARLMTLAAGLELVMAHYWRGLALTWEAAYWRDTGLLRKQLEQQASALPAQRQTVLSDLSLSFAAADTRTALLQHQCRSGALGDSPLIPIRSCVGNGSRTSDLSRAASNYHTQTEATPIRRVCLRFGMPLIVLSRNQGLAISPRPVNLAWFLTP